MISFRKALLSIIIVGVVSSCKHPLEIYGEGDIISSSGLRDCSLEDFQAGLANCTENALTGAYIETYTAVPRTGWVFNGWKTYCAHDSAATQCSFNTSAAVVAGNPVTVWPLRAEFIEECTEPDCVQFLAPILGAVSDTTIKIWQATKSDADFKVRYRTGSNPWSEASDVINAASGFVGTVKLTNLQPDTLYEYETQLNGVTYFTSTFTTLPGADFAGQIRFGFGTDFAHYEHPFLTLGQAATKNLDFMLMIGDLAYMDLLPTVTNTVGGYTDRYWLNWNEPNFSALGLSTPLFMMWDDHEIINDYWPGKLTPDRYPAARAAFDLYVGSHNPDTDGGVLYYSFSAPGADFFVLDTRSYRDPATDVDDASKSMLGDVQRNALLDYLETSTAAFKFIVTSVPFSLGEESSDTWSNYRTERELILSELESRNIANVVFLSGDRHWSGAFRIISPSGYVYYDFLPSPGGTPNRDAPVGNSHPSEEDVIYISDTLKMFGDFQIDLSVNPPTLRAAFVDENGDERCVITIGNDETGVFGTGPAATCLAPGTPVLTVSDKTSTTVTLAWNDVTAETGYSLRRSTSASDVLNAASEIAHLDADVTTYADSNLTPNTTYYYQLVAENDTAESPSPVISAKTLPPAGCF